MRFAPIAIPSAVSAKCIPPVKPLGHKAKARNEEFAAEYSKAINRFAELIVEFCNTDGSINCDKVRLNPKTGVGEHTRPRVWLDAPHVQPFARDTFKNTRNFFVRWKFFAPPSRWRALARRGRARKTSRGARALPIRLGFSGLIPQYQEGEIVPRFCRR